MSLILAKPAGQKLTLAKSFTWNETIWNPSMIQTALWLDAADNTTVFSDAGITQAVAGSSTVQQWKDKSGNARNISQSSLTLRPAYTSAGLNARQVLTFDGIDDRFGAINLPNASNNLNVFTVFNATTKGAYYNVFDANNANPMVWIDSSNRLEVNQLIGAVSNSAVTGAYRVFGIRIRSSTNPTLTIWINGTQNTSSNITTPTWPASYAISLFNRSGTLTFSGAVAEMIFIDGSLTDGTRQRIEGYLAHKWGLTANLPAGHPYKTVGPTP